MFLKISLPSFFIFSCNSFEQVISCRTLFIFPSFDQLKLKLLEFWKFLETILFHIFVFFKTVCVFWYYLKTPNLKFLNLVITQHNIVSNFWNFEYFLNRLCPIFFFFKMVLVCWHCVKTSKCVSEPDQATVKYLNKFSKFHKFHKMDVSFKNPS